MFENLKRKANQVKKWASEHEEEIGTFLVGFGIGMLCVAAGYAAGRAHNPKIEMNYICDADGRLLSASMNNLTGQPIHVQLTNDQPDLPSFTEKVIPNEVEYGGVTKAAVETYNLK